MKAHPADERLEDLTFLDETGVGATEAAKRTGFTSAHAMEKWLDRQGRTDLWQSLKRRDPAGTHLSGTQRKERRLMSIQTTDPIAALITQAQQSTRARTRKKADKISDLVADLRSILAAEREEDERKTEARKEIERLERELAKAKAKLRSSTTTQSTLDVDASVSAADIRAWAAENAIECPAMGRIPVAVREAYDAAEGDAA